MKNVSSSKVVIHELYGIKALTMSSNAETTLFRRFCSKVAIHELFDIKALTMSSNAETTLFRRFCSLSYA